jgi:hypothetical protein
MDRDKRWLNAFWKQLSKDLRMNLSYSSAYHPQKDGQTERINEAIEAYLREMTLLLTRAENFELPTVVPPLLVSWPSIPSLW